MAAVPIPRVVEQLKVGCASCGLAQLCLPASIGHDELERLDAVVRAKRTVERGQALYRTGDAFEALHVVRAGSFKTSAESESGETQILGFHLPGEIIGFDAVVSERHRCTAEALERANVCVVPFAELTRVAAQLPELQRQLMRVVSHEVVQDQKHLVMMGRRRAEERLAIFLVSLCDRYRRLQRDPALLTLSMSRYDLANYLGLVVETVSRLFSRFHELGVLDVQRKTVRVLDERALRALASEAPASECADKSAPRRRRG